MNSRSWVILGAGLFVIVILLILATRDDGRVSSIEHPRASDAIATWEAERAREWCIDHPAEPGCLE